MKRASFLEHVSWTGAGIVWTLGTTGVLRATPADAADHTTGSGFSFVQISDSHIGFTRPENADVGGTLERTVDAINALPQQPAFVMHTGDVTHLSKPAQFDTAKSMLSKLKAPLLTIPGEHDVIGSPAAYFAAFNTAHAPKGWSAWDQGGIHFLSLVNVFNFEISGKLGSEQLDFAEKDLAARQSTTPIVVFGHVPLYALYPTWGWTTEDGARLLAALRRFDAVTVLNGHIHQILTQTEGNITFATAASTAYPQPAPGSAPKPGPLAVPPGELLAHLGYRSVAFNAQRGVRYDDRNLA